MYLWQKDSGFFFQMRIPSVQAVNLGSTPLRVWLGPLRKREAQRRAMALAVRAVEGFRADMDRETLTRSLKALADELETLRRAEFSASMSVATAKGAVDEELAHGGYAQPELVAYYREKEARASGRKEVVASVRQRLHIVGHALENDAVALTAERAAYAHALATVAAIGRPAETAQPLPVAVPAGPALAAVAPVVSPIVEEHRDEREITADTLLSVGGKIFLDLRKAAKGESVRGDKDHYQERLEHALKAFVEVIGDKPLRFYLPLHMQDFATVMAKCPKNRTKYEQFKGHSIRRMCEINEKAKKPIPTLSESAVSGLLSDFGSLWKKVTAGVRDVKNIRDFRVTMPDGVRKGIVREGLPVTSLNIWMKAAAALYPREEYKKFMPLAALLTGMRQGELVWLQPKDIVEIDGHTVIDLREPLLIDGKKVARSLKTETSPRLVALHPFLEKAGFLDFARTRRNWVFGEFHRAKNASRAAQGQMAVWMRGLEIHAEHKHVFHSLRHNAKHWIRVPLGKHIADRQCGHAPGSVGDGYGFPVLQADEIEQIEALPLPKGVDFSGFRKG